MQVSLGVMVSHKAAALLDRAYVRELASALEDEGCESVWIADHPALTADMDGRWFPSPLEWLTLVAASSTTLRLGTAVLVLPTQHPIVLAKRIATVDRLSGGRLIIGVGLGSQIGEMRALDVDLGHRAAMATESIEVMKAIWTATGRASFDGRFFSFRNVDPTPAPAQPLGPPIMIGGDTLAAARRAGRLGHGLIPLGCEPELIQQLIDVARIEAVHGGWDTQSMAPTVQFDSDPSRLRRLLDTGASRVIIDAPASGDLDQLRHAVRSATQLLADVNG